MLSIITAPNPVLAQKAKSVKKIDGDILRLILEMKQTLISTEDPKGVGLAAPQVGKSVRIFLAKPTDKSQILVFINPQILQKSSKVDYVKRPARPTGGPKKDTSLPASQAERGGLGKKASKKLEGCLSLPAIWGPVLRASTLTLQYQLITENLELITKTRTFSGFLATIIQHETDHLDGILFPKHVLEQKGQLYKSHKDEKGEDEFEEIEI